MNICTIRPKRAALSGRNAVGVSLGSSLGGLLPLIVRMGFFLLKFSRLEPPAFLLKTNHLIQSSGLARLCEKKYYPKRSEVWRFFFSKPKGEVLSSPMDCSEILVQKGCL